MKDKKTIEEVLGEVVQGDTNEEKFMVLKEAFPELYAVYEKDIKQAIKLTIKNKDDEFKEKIKKLERLAKINLDDLKKQVEKDKKFKEELKKVITTIAKQKAKKPEFFYKFPKEEMDVNELAKWVDLTMLYYEMAQSFESQERGVCCSVDRAYKDWLKPKCAELLKFIRKKKDEEFEKAINKGIKNYLKFTPDVPDINEGLLKHEIFECLGWIKAGKELKSKLGGE